MFFHIFALLGAATTDGKLLKAEPINFSTHGTDWAACEGRGDILQSPIDLDGDGDAPPGTVRDGQFHIDYQPLSEATLLNDGSTFRFVIKSNSTLYVESFGSSGGDERWSPERTFYTLKHIDIRGAAEHTFRGRRHPIEVQLVHENEEVGIPIIVSLFYDCKGCTVHKNPERLKVKLSFLDPEYTQEQAPEEMDDAQQSSLVFRSGRKKKKKKLPSFPNLLDAVKETPDVGVDTALKFDPPIDLNVMMSKFDFFLYAGSTTLPPCSPASWLIQNGHFDAPRDRVQSAFDLLKKLSKGYGNFRYIHPLYDRPVLLMSPLLPKVEVPKPPVLERSKDPTVVEANKLNEESMNYANDLEARLKSAAEQNLAVWNEPAPAPAKNYSVSDYFNTLNMEPKAAQDDAATAVKTSEAMGRDLLSRIERAANATISGLKLEPATTTPKPTLAPKYNMTKDELYKLLVSYGKREIGNMVSKMTDQIVELGKQSIAKGVEKEGKEKPPGPP